MPREICVRCRRPKESCLCPREEPMVTRTRIVLLMHPKEWRRERCGTGLLTRLNLANSEIFVGTDFDGDPRVAGIVSDSANFPLLLYPGPGAIDLSVDAEPLPAAGHRRLVVFLIDSTWSCSRTVLRANPGLGSLPRLSLRPREKSRWVIKRQPSPAFLSTLETVHELLLYLEQRGLDSYPDKKRLLDSFAAMQAYQVERATRSGNPRWKGSARKTERDSR
ncbi:MAG: tRNA-uridine aminocarboxypropyltransferase [Spirochaetaceae bacterium]|nr:tRNA-uridine aminocarboxypropyltransferase [Spirochaetaceae bacterium]